MEDTTTMPWAPLVYFEAQQTQNRVMTSQTKCLVYASSIGENALLAYELDRKTCALTPIGSPIELGVPWALTLSPNGRFLYAAAHGEHVVASLEIDPVSGAATLLDVMPLDTRKVLQVPTYLTVDPTGRHLLVCDYYRDKLASFALAEDGRIRSESAATVSVGPGVGRSPELPSHPHSIQLDPSGRFVVVPFTGADSIHFFRWDATTGRMSDKAVGSVATVGGTGPRHFAFHPTRPLVYFANERGERHSSVTLFERANGEPKLRELDTWPTIPTSHTSPNAIADIHMTPDARFLYVSNRGHDSLAGYAISTDDGSLEPLGQFPTGAAPTTFAIENAGELLLSASTRDGSLSVHRIDQGSGALSTPAVTACTWFGDESGRMEPVESAATEQGTGVPWVVTLTLPA